MQGLGIKKHNTRVSAFSPLPGLVETRITDFRFGHGFTKQSAAGTQTDDTTAHLNGTQSLRLATDGDGVAVFSRSGLFSPALDLTNQSLVMRLKTGDIANTSEITIYLSSDNFSANWYIFPFDDPATNFYKDGEWVVVTMNFSDATVTGSPDRAGINKIQLRVKDNSSTAVAINFASLGSIPEPGNGMLSFTFDDGWLSQYDEAKKKMSEFGFPGTAYIIKDNVGQPGFLSLNQMRELEDLHGWEMATHHGTNLTTVSLSEAESRIRSEKQWLIDHGFNRGVDHFAIPNGAFNQDLMNLFKKYFRTARTIAPTGETFPPADWHRLRVLNVINTTTTTQIASAVDDARTNKYWLILLFHKIVVSPSASTEYSIADFETVVNDIAADGIAVKTISQAIIDG
ncbi:MAG: hypothetical protein NPINA01_18050 [Nitrospinaceae bacterium]|nr:MAG: hypothetical protein NPINA01_18050 [Nitrospinaceae bacterium]